MGGTANRTVFIEQPAHKMCVTCICYKRIYMLAPEWVCLYMKCVCASVCLLQNDFSMAHLLNV